ncbi:MAG: dUTP diphosphatase [Deltaproteobacteria bacterium]|nr:dUTP diphosphatase [Deltaproteobacteria bacterium]MBM4322780.1 dUTP diphosphatase [Deltaproteobacteria bacterium]MBM4346751.1 dUTP diphosphatase [Deltaproteobacteria bacterium]
MEQVKVYIKRFKKNHPTSLPQYMTEGSSGMDLFASLEEEVIINPGERKLIPTGISVAIPEGFEGQIRPRSGLAIQKGIGMVNAPGTIDSDYRGEVGVLLINLGNTPFSIRNGERIAQMVISRVFRSSLVEVEDLPPTRRQGGGFGSTGV